MGSFLYLEKIYDEPGQRNIAFLAELYSNKDLLRKFIFELTKNNLNLNNVYGKQVLIKPNWVNHSRNPFDDICLISNSNLIIALVEILLPFKPKIITIGDAPVQGCNWEKLLLKTFIDKIKKLSEHYKIEICIRDFRRVIFNTQRNNLTCERNPLSDYVIFDLGHKSFLEPITKYDEKKFRVAHYDYKKLSEVHLPGVHKYCISKSLFESDIIISLPKVKTHQKTGITAALKNIVGLNGDKDYLPHHRKGGTKRGGDSYPGNNFLTNLSEDLIDVANKKIGKISFKYWQKIAITLWKLSNIRKVYQFGAAWYGNDTTWRMVLDLNLIVLYGKLDGQISETPQRILYNLCDGIIGGEGDGPLFPKPLPLGFLSFSNNSAVNDYVFAKLMKLNAEKIPLIMNSFNLFEKDFDTIYLNGSKISEEALEQYAINTLPPPGWEKYLEYKK